MMKMYYLQISVQKAGIIVETIKPIHFKIIRYKLNNLKKNHWFLNFILYFIFIQTLKDFLKGLIFYFVTLRILFKNVGEQYLL